MIVKRGHRHHPIRRAVYYVLAFAAGFATGWSSRPPRAATEDQHLAIGLTRRAPIQIETAKWPMVASVSDGLGADRYSLTVRQHVDGRAIIYGVLTPTAGERTQRAGEVLPAGSDISAGLYRVADALGFHRGLVEECAWRMGAEPVQ